MKTFLVNKGVLDVIWSQRRRERGVAVITCVTAVHHRCHETTRCHIT